MNRNIITIAVALATLNLIHAPLEAQGRLQGLRNRTSQKPSGDNLSETQKQNLTKLKTNLMAIKEASEVTQEQKDALTASLMAIRDGATKPDKTLVKKFATDLSEAISDGDFDQKEIAKLANDLRAILNSANITQAELDKAKADLKAILESSNVDKADVQLILADIQAIVDEARKNISQKGGGTRGSRFQRR